VAVQRRGRRTAAIINYSGGTEISGGIVMGNVLTPLSPARLPGRCRAWQRMS